MVQRGSSPTVSTAFVGIAFRQAPQCGFFTLMPANCSCHPLARVLQITSGDSMPPVAGNLRIEISKRVHVVRKRRLFCLRASSSSTRMSCRSMHSMRSNRRGRAGPAFGGRVRPQASLVLVLFQRQICSEVDPLSGRTAQASTAGHLHPRTAQVAVSRTTSARPLLPFCGYPQGRNDRPCAH